MSPFDNFTVFKFFSLDLYFFNYLFDFSFSNTSYFLVLLFFFYLSVLFFNSKEEGFKSFNPFFLVFNHFSTFFKPIYEFNYLPYIITLFFFILFSNLLGIIPYSFTITSQFVITFFLSFTNMFAITFIGFLYHRLGFFNLFLPKGVPFAILPIICFIEFVSYISRILSLSIRLAANMISGHVILTLLASVGFLLVPLLFFIYLLEILVAFIQAYVFAVLVSIYLYDVIHIHSH